MGAGTIKTTKEVLFQLNTQKPRGPAIPCLGSDPEKIRIHSDPCTLFSGQLDWQWPRTRTVAGQNLGFLCPVKPNKKILRQSLKEIRRWLLFSSQQRGEHSRIMPQGLCLPPPAHEEPRGLYKGMAHSQVSVMRNKVGRIYISSLCNFSKTVLD